MIAALWGSLGMGSPRVQAVPVTAEVDANQPVTPETADASSAVTEPPSEQQPPATVAPVIEPVIPTAPKPPAVSQVDHSLTVTDAHGDPVDKNTQVASGDQVTYQFRLQYRPGTPSNEQLHFAFNRPKNITFKSATVTTATGKTTAAHASSSKVRTTIMTPLNADNPWIEITVVAAANWVKRLSSVEGGSAFTTIDTARTTFELPNYQILPVPPLFLSLDESQFDVAKSGKVQLSGQLDRQGGFKNEDITIYIQKGDQTLAQFKLDSAAEPGAFVYELAATELTTGTNDLEIYAVDEHELRSDSVLLTVNVRGDLSFKEVPEQATFTAVTLTGRSQVIGRADNWHLQISDERPAGAHWRLIAAATTFKTAQGRDLAGWVVYQAAGQDRVMLTTTGTVVAQGTTTPTTTLFDTATTWSAQTGVLMEVRGDALPGKYTGTITWTLEDAPG
ncbi:hypothetical protein [Lactobacillus sp. CBA3605]|uniref:hypothetical protein n=1 Tax=Lactobacillus sp. CBA3605 TaxID=2099788 RepID=UPI001319C1D6|nr:hypothetical protein [Lactobacillus sp. CBA3605]